MRRRLDLSQLERWLESPEGRVCVHRRGRPGRGERPLVVAAAQRFQVDRRTVERALARLARRNRLLAEHLPIDAATAAQLVNAAKSFSAGAAADNTTDRPAQMRRSESTPSVSRQPQGFTLPDDTSRSAVVAAVRQLLASGWLRLDELLDTQVASGQQVGRGVDDQLAAVGLRPAPSNPSNVGVDPLSMSRSALLDAIDAFESCSDGVSAHLGTHLTAVRQALAGTETG